MAAKYKIFYTDDTSLLWSDVSPNGDPKLIPAAKRIGVHSIIQPIDNETVREVVEQYHYIFSIRDNNWVGVGIDGLLDWLANDFDNIRCIMHGRTLTTNKFWEIRQRIRSDPDIIGGVSAQRAAEMSYMIEHKYRDLYWMSGGLGHEPVDDQRWSENARHRPYHEDYSERPIYGFETFYG